MNKMCFHHGSQSLRKEIAMYKSRASVQVRNQGKGKKKDNGGEREESQSQMPGGKQQKW